MITVDQQKIFVQKVKEKKAGVAKSAPIEEVGAVESDHPVLPAHCVSALGAEVSEVNECLSPTLLVRILFVHQKFCFSALPNDVPDLFVPSRLTFW